MSEQTEFKGKSITEMYPESSKLLPPVVEEIKVATKKFLDAADIVIKENGYVFIGTTADYDEDEIHLYYHNDDGNVVCIILSTVFESKAGEPPTFDQLMTLPSWVTNLRVADTLGVTFISESTGSGAGKVLKDPKVEDVVQTRLVAEYVSRLSALALMLENVLPYCVSELETTLPQATPGAWLEGASAGALVAKTDERPRASVVTAAVDQLFDTEDFSDTNLATTAEQYDLNPVTLDSAVTYLYGNRSALALLPKADVAGYKKDRDTESRYTVESIALSGFEVADVAVEEGAVFEIRFGQPCVLSCDGHETLMSDKDSTSLLAKHLTIARVEHNQLASGPVVFEDSGNTFVTNADVSAETIAAFKKASDIATLIQGATINDYSSLLHVFEQHKKDLGFEKSNALVVASDLSKGAQPVRMLSAEFKDLNLTIACTDSGMLSASWGCPGLDTRDWVESFTTPKKLSDLSKLLPVPYSLIKLLDSQKTTENT